MGQSNSSASHETPINLSQDVIESLAQQLADPHPSGERQSALDDQVRASINAQLNTLRRSEAEIRLELQAALEKENLDREKTIIDDSGSAPNSNLLLGDIVDLKSKVDRFRARSSLDQLPDVKQSAEELTQCFKDNPDTSLNCLNQVKHFKASVAKAQQDYFKTLAS